MSETPHDPMRAAQAAMRPAPLRRFYRAASFGERAGGQDQRLLSRRQRAPSVEQ